MSDKDKVTFSGGSTSGGVAAPYHLMTWEGAKRTALRFQYGNTKHEDGQNVLADANWLKSFHARDLPYFKDRINHAIEHLQKEQQGHFDSHPGGNWGAVGWCVDILSFIDEYDHDFYLAVVGLKPHPGPREKDCGCPRCGAGKNPVPTPEPLSSRGIQVPTDLSILKGMLNRAL